jgi:hypothetical protein
MNTPLRAVAIFDLLGMESRNPRIESEYGRDFTSALSFAPEQINGDPEPRIERINKPIRADLFYIRVIRG